MYMKYMLLLLLFLLQVATCFGKKSLEWRFKSQDKSPAKRGFHEMAELNMGPSASKQALLFGGLSGGTNTRSRSSRHEPYQLHNDTWVFNPSASGDMNGNREWIRLYPPVAPPARYLHAMTSTGTIFLGAAVMYGGLSSAVHATTVANIQQPKDYLNDVWLFNLHEVKWMQLKSEPGDGQVVVPTPRAYHRLSRFQPENSSMLVLMFGGRLQNGDDTDETFVLELRAGDDSLLPGTITSVRALWYLLAPSVAPSKRTGHSMSRLGKNSVVMFGGYNQKEKKLLDDTWVFVGNTQNTVEWTCLVKAAPAVSMASFLGGIDYPTPRRFASFVSFDAETAILFGGTIENDLTTSEKSLFSDNSVWHLSRNTDNNTQAVSKRYTWRRLVDFGSNTGYIIRPSSRYGHSAATVGIDNGIDNISIVLFGGRGERNDTHQTSISVQDDTWIFYGGCPGGTYRKVDQHSGCFGCYTCSRGTYKNRTAFVLGETGTCTPCPSGTTTRFEGSTALYQCNLCNKTNFQGAGSCTVDTNFHTEWICLHDWYGNSSGAECEKQCNCGYGKCTDGFHGDGSCACYAHIFWFDPNGQCHYPIVFIIVMFIICGSVLYVFRRYYCLKRIIHKQRRQNFQLEVKQQLLSEKHGEEILEYQDGWKIDEDDLVWTQSLAAGGYGEVWKGKYAAFPGEIVAIKKFFITPDSMDEILTNGAFGDQEVALLTKTPSHRNVLFVIGAGQLKKSGQIFLVSEFMSGGDLRTLLDRTSELLPWERRVQIASDIAEGMAFLHSRGLIHRDLKSLNILLDGRGRSKIADFGLSKVTGSHNAILRSANQCIRSASSASLASSTSNASSSHFLSSSLESKKQTTPRYGKAAMFKLANDMEHALSKQRKSEGMNWFNQQSRQHCTNKQEGGLTFKGKEAVEWLVESGGAANARDAMSLGTKLLEAGYFSLLEVLEREGPDKYTEDDDYVSNGGGYDVLLNDKRVEYVFLRERMSLGENQGGGGYIPPVSLSTTLETKSTTSAATTLTTSNSNNSDHSSQRSCGGKQSNGSGGSGGSSRNGGSSGSKSGSSGSKSGVSKEPSPLQTLNTGRVGSLLWMAPEIMLSTDGVNYGLETDVFSFGVVLYEIITRKVPWVNEMSETKIYSAVVTRVIQGVRPTLSTDERSSALENAGGKLLLDIMQQSWEHNPVLRPTFDSIASSILRVIRNQDIRLGGDGAPAPAHSEHLHVVANHRQSGRVSGEQIFPIS